MEVSVGLVFLVLVIYLNVVSGSSILMQEGVWKGRSVYVAHPGT